SDLQSTGRGRILLPTATKSLTSPFTCLTLTNQPRMENTRACRARHRILMRYRSSAANLRSVRAELFCDGRRFRIGLTLLIDLSQMEANRVHADPQLNHRRLVVVPPRPAAAISEPHASTGRNLPAAGRCGGWRCAMTRRTSCGDIGAPPPAPPTDSPEAGRRH